MSDFGGKADMTVCGKSAFTVALGCKADMACCSAYVGFWPKANMHGKRLRQTKGRAAQCDFRHAQTFQPWQDRTSAVLLDPVRTTQRL